PQSDGKARAKLEAEVPRHNYKLIQALRPEEFELASLASFPMRAGARKTTPLTGMTSRPKVREIRRPNVLQFGHLISRQLRWPSAGRLEGQFTIHPYVLLAKASGEPRMAAATA